MFVADYIANLADVSIDTASMAVVLFSILPLTILYTKLVPASAIRLRHITSILLSSILFIANFDKWIYINLVISTLYTYAGVHFLKQWNINNDKKFNKKYKIFNPWIIFLINFIHLFYIQWGSKRYFTAAFMMAVVKNTMFAWDYTTEHDDISFENCTILDYLGYIFFLPTFFVGGPFSFKHFYKCQLSMKNEKNGKNKKEDYITQIISKRRKIAIAKSLLWVLILSIGYLRLVGISYQLTLTEKYANESFFKRFLLLQLYGFSSRLQYYIAWKLSEACGLIAGLGFTGTNFDGLKNSDVVKTETAKNLRVYIASWNSLTAIWLKNYVYKNFANLGFSSITTTVFTFVISAMWHGIHPGYYLTFVSGAFFTVVSRKLHKYFAIKIQRQRLIIKIIYRSCSWIITWTLINYIAAPFMVFEFNKGIKIWSHNYFIFHIAGAFICLLL